MSIRFNADEVMQIAIRIEQNGAAFYQKAAEVVEDEEASAFLKSLVDWEHRHEETFKRIRADLQGKASHDKVVEQDEEWAQYLNAIADGEIFNTEATAEDLLKLGSTLEAILDTAIQAEKDSVIFYTALKEMVPDGLGRHEIEKIIEEEMGHVRVLSRDLARIKSGA